MATQYEIELKRNPKWQGLAYGPCSIAFGQSAAFGAHLPSVPCTFRHLVLQSVRFANQHLQLLASSRREHLVAHVRRDHVRVA